MPIFTAAATAIVSSFIGGAVVAGTAAAFAVSVIATGLAIITARILLPSAGGGARGSASQDTGVRVQIPPATNNKIPVIYGRVFQQGIITDARLSADRQVMTYVLILSEKTATGTFTCENIYWNDQKLVFKSGSDSHIVEKGLENYGRIDPDTSAVVENTKLNGLIKIRVYAGSTDSSNQIFPTNNATNARDFIGETDHPTYLLNNLVFAVVQLTYSQENGVTALAPTTFEISNTLKNPGLVWYDYITNSTYGANISASLVNTSTSIDTANTLSLYSISNQIPANQFNSDGSTSTQVRYEINGVLSTGDSQKVNLEKINIASSSWTTFDHSLGQWKVIVNRAATAGELTNAFIFNDDNIIGDIQITATALEDLFNSVEVEFPNKDIEDQIDYYSTATIAGLRNDNEPDNELSMKVDMVNNAIHAARIGNIELKQSRVDLIITFRADYSALQVDVGDVIKVTNAIYGFNEKLFRVTRTREIEDTEGQLYAEITALEYDATVYDDQTLSQYVPTDGSGIPSFGGSSLPAPSAPVVSNVNETANVPNFTISSTIDATSQPVTSIEWFYSSSSASGYVFLENERAVDGEYVANQTITDVITTLKPGTWYLKARTVAAGRTSALSAASTAFTWNPRPAGANDGTINTATFADQIFVSAATSGTYNVLFAQPLNDYDNVFGDNDITYNASLNQLSVANEIVTTLTATNLTNTTGSSLNWSMTTATVSSKITFTPLTAEPSSYSTGTVAVADAASWDPAGTNQSTKYPAFYNGTKWIDLGSPAIYGQFLTTATQSIATATEVVAIPFDITDISNGVTLTTSSHINVSSSGTYFAQFSAVFENTDNTAHRAILWYRRNGSDIPDSATAITVPARHGSIDGTAVMTVPVILNLNKDDYVELYWNATDAAIGIAAISSSTVAPVYPRTPGVLFSINKVAGGSS